MSKTELLGKLSFINHEKQYAMIEYEVNGKKKTVRGSIDLRMQKDLKDKKVIRKVHHFMIGDMVSFNIKASDKGDKVDAVNIEYLYNSALDMVINKASTNNSFKGYLKAGGDQLFVKEMESYVFFPVQVSPWQVLPTADELNEPVIFSLDHPEKKDKAMAVLSRVRYIPEYYTALKLFTEKKAVEAVIYRITSHSVYVHVVKDKVSAKLPLTDTMKDLKVGDKLTVQITFLGPTKIAVEPA